MIIDTDTAADDAVAIGLAAISPHADIRAVTVVAGNVPIETATQNALNVLSLCGATEVPVYMGASRPLLRELSTAEDVHGEGGLSGVVLKSADRLPEDERAAAALVRLAAESVGTLTLVTLGPLTNIAIALSIDPGFLEKFQSVICMVGTSDSQGNITPTAEYNAWADPEALAIVLRSARPELVTLVGWDISRTSAVITADDQWRLREAGNFGNFTDDVCSAIAAYGKAITGVPGYDLADPIAMAIALDDRVSTRTVRVPAHVALDAEQRGQLVMDRRPSAADANVTVVTCADSDLFKEMLFQAAKSTRVNYPAETHHRATEPRDSSHVDPRDAATPTDPQHHFLDWTDNDDT